MEAAGRFFSSGQQTVVKIESWRKYTIYMHAHICQLLPQVAPWGVFRAMQCASKAFQQSPIAMFTTRRWFRTLARMINGPQTQFWYRLPNRNGDGWLYNIVNSRITHVKYCIRGEINGVYVRYRQCGDTTRVKYVGRYIKGMCVCDTYYCADGSMKSHMHRMGVCEYKYVLFDNLGCGEFIASIKRAGVVSTRVVHPHDDKLWLECCGCDVFAVAYSYYLDRKC